MFTVKKDAASFDGTLTKQMDVFVCTFCRRWLNTTFYLIVLLEQRVNVLKE